MSEQAKKLKYCVNGEWLTSETKTYMNCGSQSGLSGVVEYTCGKTCSGVV